MTREWRNEVFATARRTETFDTRSLTGLLQQMLGPLGALYAQSQMIDPHWYLRGDRDDD